MKYTKVLSLKPSTDISQPQDKYCELQIKVEDFSGALPLEGSHLFESRSVSSSIASNSVAHTPTSIADQTLESSIDGPLLFPSPSERTDLSFDYYSCDSRFSRECPRPKWQPNAEADKCSMMLCENRFTTIRNGFPFYGGRHHCRQCGRVVCAECSQGMKPLLPPSDTGDVGNSKPHLRKLIPQGEQLMCKLGGIGGIFQTDTVADTGLDQAF